MVGVVPEFQAAQAGDLIALGNDIDTGIIDHGFPGMLCFFKKTGPFEP